MVRSGSENPVEVTVCGPAGCPVKPVNVHVFPPSADRQLRTWFVYAVAYSGQPPAAFGSLYRWVVPPCALTMIEPSCATIVTGSPPGRFLSTYLGGANWSGATSCE